MEFSFTEKGARKLIRNEYQYVKQKDLANGLTSWEYIECRKGNCKEKVKVNSKTTPLPPSLNVKSGQVFLSKA